MTGIEHLRTTGWGYRKMFNPWDLFVVLAASTYSPVQVWSINPEGPSLSVALAVAGALFLVGVGFRFLLVKIGLEISGATYVAAFSVLYFTVSGSLINRMPFGRVGLLILGLVLVLMIYRLRGLTPTRWLITWGAFILVISPLTTIVMDLFEAPPESNVSLDVAPGAVHSTQDVVIVIADAYPAVSVLEEFYSFDNSSFVEALRGRGLVAGDVLANYSHTTLSVPSLLQMDYVADDSLLNGSDVEALLAVIRGENSFAGILENSGYESVYVESGWLGARCGPSVTVCVKAPWPDETLYDIAYRTLLRDMPGFVTGTSFNKGAMHAIQWLETDLETYLSNDRPDYIYVHILAPHPPLFLNSECEADRGVELGGFSITYPGISESENQARRDAYVSQVECVNGVVLDVADMAIEWGANLVFLGDHGPDGQAQLFVNGGDWTQSQIAERLGTFAATYTPDCEVELAASIVDLLPPVLRCLGGPSIEERAPRAFVARRDATGTRVTETEAPDLLAASQ